ncbi:MAG: phosphotransferase [Acidimicrobiales bacterium]|nr:phosphotransferase [Acidimicrobiales bacterium]
MTDVPLISHPDDVTPEWLTTVLTRAGQLDGGRVASIDPTPVGTGQVGDSVRFGLTYEGGSGPATVVGKFPSEDETSRASSVATRTYEIETRFYQQLRDRVDIATPEPYLALLDVEANEFVLIMNDLAPAEQGDQMRGCTVDEAALGLEEAAKLHAPLWGDSSLVGVDWLDRASPEGQSFYVQLLGMLYPGFLERYGDRVDAEVAELGQVLVEQLAGYMATRPEPLTVTHGDYRVDNMLFGTTEGGAPLTVVDWQTAALAPAMVDVSYLLGTSLTPEDRAAHEHDLVAQYHQHLLTAGITDFDFDRCWHDYRRFAFSGFLMAVGASMIVGQTDRGDEMFMAMANRSGRMAVELESLALIDGE